VIYGVIPEFLRPDREDIEGERIESVVGGSDNKFQIKSYRLREFSFKMEGVYE